MNQIEQKAQLLDNYMLQLRERLTNDAFVNAYILLELNETFTLDYKKIEDQKTLSENPYIDEIFSGRLLRFLTDWLKMKTVPRLSDCPHVNYLKNQRSIGIKSISDYETVMQKFGFIEKIINLEHIDPIKEARLARERLSNGVEITVNDQFSNKANEIKSSINELGKHENLWHKNQFIDKNSAINTTDALIALEDGAKWIREQNGNKTPKP